jgi:hypothetical protein
MKRLDTLVTIMTVGALVCAAFVPATSDAATPVKNVMMAKSGDFTEVTLLVPSHQLCEHFTEPATADRPFRIVLNLCNCEHAMPQQNYSALPECMVKKIRTSQYSTDPDKVVRVVLDLKSSATYTVRTEPDRLVIAIADPSPSYSAWEACPPAMLAKSDSKAKPASIEGQPAKKQESVTAPVPSNSASADMAQASKTDVATKKVEKPQITPPASAASASTSTKPSQSLALEPVAEPKASKDMPEPGTPSEALTTDELIGPATKNEPPVMTMGTESVSPFVITEPMENFALPSQPLVLAPELLDAADVGPAAAANPVGVETQPATMPAFTGNTPQVPATEGETPMLAATGNPATDVALPATVSSSDTLTGQDALIDRLKAKFFSGARAPKPYLTEEGILAEQLKTGEVTSFGPPSPGADMDREALLERIRQAAIQNEQHIPANMLPSVPGGPVRTEVFYDDLGRRDPFEPLLKGLRSGFISEELPSVEALRMVGVLKDDDQSLALMEDTDGHSYIMRPGDPVANGRVLSVGEARTVIQVDEYGWTRTVVLQLTSRGGDPSKRLGARSSSAEEEAASEPPMPE